MKRFAALAALAAVAVAVGIYFGTREDSTVPRVPKPQQSAILEEAKADGLISTYTPHARRWWYSPRIYDVGGGEMRLTSYSRACGGPRSGGQCLAQAPLFVLEYRRTAATEAQAILRIVRAYRPNARVKSYEITTLNSHTPDARIMLIPKAGA